MSGFWKLLGKIKNYKPNVVLNIICNILMVFFSIISAPALIPFLEILLGQEELITSNVPLTFNAESIVHNFNFYLSQVIIEHGKEQALLYLCVGLIGIYFFKNLFRYLSLFFMAPVRNGIVRDVRKSIFSKILMLPISYFSEQRKGDIMSRISSDVQEIEWSILNVLEVIIREPLTVIGFITLMLYFSPSLTGFVFLLIILTAVLIGGIGKVLRAKSSAVQEKLGSIVSITEETLGGLRVIKGFNAEEYISGKFDKENNAYKRLLTRLLWRRDLSSPLSEFLGIAIVSILIWYGFKEVQSGIITVPTFITFLYAFFSIIAPAKSFSTAYYNIQKGIAALDRVDVILDADLEVEEISSPVPFNKFEESIHFNNISFQYNSTDQNVIDGIELKIKKGSVIALVGSSGAGKSTLVDLLPRFYDVSKGTIYIDGIDIKNMSLHQLRSQLGIVTQEALLFNDTIYNNITFGLDNVTEEDVYAAAKVANAHEFILESEHGYQTNIGDRGVKLSGGQRQRLTIARAILKNPPILILDEATSALDSESEKLVQNALTKLMEGRTAIVIAHRLSTVQHVDKIIVLKNGRIEESGTHQELLKLEGEYSKFVELQAF